MREPLNFSDRANHTLAGLADQGAYDDSRGDFAMIFPPFSVRSENVDMHDVRCGVRA